MSSIVGVGRVWLDELVARKDKIVVGLQSTDLRSVAVGCHGMSSTFNMGCKVSLILMRGEFTELVDLWLASRRPLFPRNFLHLLKPRFAIMLNNSARGSHNIVRDAVYIWTDNFHIGCGVHIKVGFDVGSDGRFGLKVHSTKSRRFVVAFFQGRWASE